MDAFKELMSDYSFTDVLLIIALVYIAGEFIYEKVSSVITSIKNNKEQYHQVESEKENKEEEIEERLKRLERHDNFQYKSLNDLKDSVNDIKKFCEDMRESQRVTTVATTRKQIKDTAEECLRKGYMSQSDYETLIDLKTVYLGNNGNHYVADILLPKVFALEVLSDEEISRLNN